MRAVATVHTPRLAATWLAAAVCALLVACLLFDRAAASIPPPPFPLQYVSPFIGTGGIGFGQGSLFPGAQVPFGFARPSPDTSGLVYLSFEHNGGYYYNDDEDGVIRLFSHSHMVGAGVTDLGNVGVMPVSSPISSSLVFNYGYASKFTHQQETASPGYYAVTLLTPSIDAELTATQLAAAHRYTWASPATPRSILFYISHALTPGACVASDISINAAAGTVSGSIKNAGSLSARSPAGGLLQFFFARFNTSFTAYGTWNQVLVSEGSTAANGTDVGGYVTFPASGAAAVEMYLGLSLISVAQAEINLNAQIPPGTDFATVAAAAVETWTAALGAVAVSGGAEEDLIKFYTGLYHSLLAPTNYAEAAAGDARVFFGFDYAVHALPASASGGPRGYYSDMSIWDTHRTQTPLLSLLRPDVAGDIVNSLVIMYQQGGDIPRWPLANAYTGCMTAQHSALVIVDAVLKGITSFNATAAYAGMYATATSPQPNAGRSDITDYVRLGWVCSDMTGSAGSMTLEYATDDWALATMAGELGLVQDEAMFAARAFGNFYNTWEPTRQIFCGKTCAGALDCPKSESEWAGLYTEGNARQWVWAVTQNLSALVELFGPAAFVARLDEFFALSQLDPTNVLPNPYYWAGNEPDIEAPFEFPWAGRADLTQRWSRWLVANKYTVNPDGIAGNDDYGTMSAWLVFAQLGLYPITGSTTFVIGSPVFDNVTLSLLSASGAPVRLRVASYGNSPTAVYVTKCALNGEAYAVPFVDFAVLTAGDTLLEFWMAEQPSDWFATGPLSPRAVTKGRSPAW